MRSSMVVPARAGLLLWFGVARRRVRFSHGDAVREPAGSVLIAARVPRSRALDADRRAAQRGRDDSRERRRIGRHSATVSLLSATGRRALVASRATRPDRSPGLTVVVASNHQFVMVRRTRWGHHERNAAVIRTDVREPARLPIDRLLRARHWLDLSFATNPCSECHDAREQQRGQPLSSPMCVVAARSRSGQFAHLERTGRSSSPREPLAIIFRHTPCVARYMAIP
jgi:hypothetical protein